MRTQKLIFLFPFFIFLGVLFISVPKVFAETHISGDIDTDTIWTKENNPYILDDYTAVLPNATLTIKEGVIVKASNPLYVLGTLNVQGTESEKVHFTSWFDDELGGDTDGEIYNEEGIEITTVPNIKTEEYLGGGISISSQNYNPSVTLDYIFISYAYYGLSVGEDDGVNVTNSIFEKNSIGISTNGNNSVNISDSIIRSNNHGISINQFESLPNSIFTVSGLSIYGNTYSGISNILMPPLALKPEKRSFFAWFFNLFKTEKAIAQEEGEEDIEEPQYDYTIDFRNTWWGDPSGPHHGTLNPNGLGNGVEDDEGEAPVLFDPWLISDPLQQSCTVDCFSNVLFLPGIKASRLYQNNGSEDQLWEPNANSDVEDLYLNTDGTSKNSSIYTRDIIKETNIPIPTGPTVQSIYKSFSNTMDDLVNDGKIADWKSFAYDWRQSVDDIVNSGTNYQNGNLSLVETLQSLVDSSKNGKVTIVAHSNGGLLAKALLKRLQDDKIAGVNNLIDDVDVLILVAVPEIGTAVAVPAIMHGYDQSILGGWLVDETRARELGRNMLSAFGLLPSKEYINHISASPATFVDTAIPSNVTTEMVQTFGSAINSYSEYKDFLFGNEGRTNPAINQTNLPINLSESLFSKAESLHDSIDVFTPPSSMRVIEVAGWGLDTVASFEYYPRLDCTGSSCKFTLDEKPRFTSDGDGTVVVPSAQYMSFLENTEKYWVNLFQINNDKFPLAINSKHKNILETQPILEFISNVIKEISFTNSAYLNTTVPIDIKNRFRISIHSPVTLDAYDVDGNHTGKICPPTSDFCYVEENIANSSYMEFGEGKYINLPEDQMSKIKLQGIDIGTFTYESEKVLPDGSSTISSFVDIPVTTQTQAEVTLNSNTRVPQLALDVTGDGVTDFMLAPSVTFDPITYLQIMKATINSLDLPQAKIKAFNKRIDNIIKSIQKGKIDKAKLKADRFKSVLEKKLSKPDSKHPKLKKLSKTDAQLLLDMLNKLLDNLN